MRDFPVSRRKGMAPMGCGRVCSRCCGQYWYWIGAEFARIRCVPATLAWCWKRRVSGLLRLCRIRLVLNWLLACRGGVESLGVVAALLRRLGGRRSEGALSNAACCVCLALCYSCGLASGGVAEWLKAADCKSARIAYAGSNPASSTKTYKSRQGLFRLPGRE
jgi:hypothetical protein